MQNIAIERKESKKSDDPCVDFGGVDIGNGYRHLSDLPDEEAKTALEAILYSGTISKVEFEIFRKCFERYGIYEYPSFLSGDGESEGKEKA